MLIVNRRPMSHKRNEVNQLFNTMFSAHPRCATPRARAGAPPMNVWEDGQNYCIEAELPGFSMNDIEVSVLDNEVTITGDRTPANIEGASYLRRERHTGKFARTWTLPDAIAADKVQASLKDGVLRVTLPKTEKTQPRKIQVKSVTA